MSDRKKQGVKTAGKTSPAAGAARGNRVHPPLSLGGASKPVPPEAGIGARIKCKREALGLNVEELARLTREYDYAEGRGISASMLRRYEYRPEDGGSNPGAREICLLCDALKVSADWLVRGIEPKREDTGPRKIADALFKAVSDVFVELSDQFSDTSTEHRDAQSKEMERNDKLRRARLPEKPPKT
jgi:transcriptional regulator with XRE-family HTH domain